MKKFFKALGVILALAVLLCAAACGGSDNGTIVPEPPAGGPAVKIKDIENVDKAYFGGFEEQTKVVIDLSEYVDAKGAQVTYEADVDKDAVAEASVENGILTLNLKGTGSTRVSVYVNSDGEYVFPLNFRLRSFTYKKIYCIGDSLTAGHSWANESYPVYLGQELNASAQNATEVGNFGYNGAQITGYGGSGANARYVLTDKYSQSIKTMENGKEITPPDLIVVMLGTNDATGWSSLEEAISGGTYTTFPEAKSAAEAFETGYLSLIDNYKKTFPECDIIVLLPPLPLSPNEFGIPASVVRDKVTPVLKKITQQLQLPGLDMRAVFESKQNAADGENTSDYVALFRDKGDRAHLSVLGAKLFARALAEKIASL